VEADALDRRERSWRMWRWRWVWTPLTLVTTTAAVAWGLRDAESVLLWLVATPLPALILGLFLMSRDMPRDPRIDTSERLKALRTNWYALAILSVFIFVMLDRFAMATGWDRGADLTDVVTAAYLLAPFLAISAWAHSYLVKLERELFMLDNVESETLNGTDR